MSRDINPYTPPKAAEVSAPEPAVQRAWKVTNGRLWVKDGAILPDICLYGSATGGRGTVKVLWLPRVANVLDWALALFGTCALLGYSWIARPGLSQMMRAFLFAALASSGIQAIVSKKNWKRHRITIQRTKGWKSLLRAAAVLCISFAIFHPVLIGLDHYLELGGFDQRQKIGIVNSLFFLWLSSTRAVLLLQIVRAVETRDGWHRIEGVHPRALEKLSLLQGRPSDENPGT